MVIFTEGRFGAAVRDLLLGSCAQSTVHPFHESIDRLEDLISGAAFVAVALWRQYERECQLLDQVCFRLGVRWSAVYLSESKLYCGPLVVPGNGPCYSCFRRRYLTHSVAPEREQALLRAYANDPNLGPPGFVPAMAGLAASALLSDFQADTAAAGRLRVVELTTGGILDTRIVPVHGCARCSQSTALPGQRTVNQLIPAIEELLK